jgi:tetratricopeptide (TPR) repeat protein
MPGDFRRQGQRESHNLIKLLSDNNSERSHLGVLRGVQRRFLGIYLPKTGQQECRWRNALRSVYPTTSHSDSSQANRNYCPEKIPVNTHSRTIVARYPLWQLLKSCISASRSIHLLLTSTLLSTRLLCVIFFLFCLVPNGLGEPLGPSHALFQNNYTIAKSNYLASPSLTNSILFATTAFQLADLSSNDTQRATFAEEGISASERALQLDPQSAPALYYLALNHGQLAQTKTLGALKLVKLMEREFLKSISILPAYDHAGAHRSLGMLYRDTPGWPASIGSKSKAREHLELAVKLAPDFPDNHLTLIESYLKWDDHELVPSAISAYRKVLPRARETFSGPEWYLSWRDWDNRWKEILGKAGE